MNDHRTTRRWTGALAAGLLALTIAGCGGGSSGSAEFPPPTLPPDIGTGPSALSAARTLDIRVDNASIEGRPVIEFTVTNQAGVGMTGLTAGDLRFSISKLQPASSEIRWQNYLNVSHDGVVQATQERVSGGAPFGTLTGLGSGRYRYTFATDITNPASNPCPAPCTDAVGQPLDLRYDPGLTHRVSVQQANRAYPRATGTLDFVPNGGVAAQREVVANATCNSCHAQLTAHGTRVDTQLCVTCHNPGSSEAGTPATTLDFKWLVHRIHYNSGGAALPSVRAGVPYVVGGEDFSEVTFTQDVRNCTRCHDAAAAPQADRWKTEASIGACTSCHDDVFFGSSPDPARPWQTNPHSGGVVADEGTCTLCHAAGKFDDAKDIAIAHGLPQRLKAAAARFRFNILGVTGAVPGGTPVITFSVTDPTRNDAPYDIKADPAFTAGGASTLAIKLGWTTAEFSNEDSGQRYGQPVTINALSDAATAGPTAGTYTVTAPALPASLTGTLRVTMEGHPAGDVTTAGAFTDRLAVTNTFRDVAVTGSVVARRVAVDIAKCNVCHGTLSLHGNNRTDEIGACTVCHNPNATDAGRRPASGGVLTGGVDGKTEETIDFKAMIHGIHAGQADKGGFRTKGVVVYGFGGSVNDFTGVVFPGRLSDCATCHVGSSYQLAGAWSAPTAAGILGTTVDTGLDPISPTDNLRMSPTVAVCSSCHDGAVARLHMQDGSTGGTFSATQATLRATAGENCEFCHGAGDALDVKTVHGVN